MAHSNNHFSEDLLRQLEQTRTALESAHSDVEMLSQELDRQRADGKQRHGQLVEELTKALQGRDAAMSALQRLETHCHHHGWDIKTLEKFKARECYHSFIHSSRFLTTR